MGAFALCCMALPVDAGVLLRGLEIDFSPFTVVALPGEQVEIGFTQGGVERLAVPEKPGYYPREFRSPDGRRWVAQVFVMEPSSALVDGVLNGYRIGPSPPGHPRRPEFYQPPAGFIEVREDMLGLRLSPHFTLGQFLCKQKSDYPKYIALRESLLVMLEGLLGEVRRRGYPAATFGVISGYRTPWYNKRIGNVANSRHVYGDAMDLFVDLDGDGRLDDMDRDGDRDLQDVTVLYEIATDYMATQAQAGANGGVGRYRQTHRHGGFVHVDTRGYPARW